MFSRTSKPSFVFICFQTYVGIIIFQTISLDMYSASLGIHLIISYEHNGKVIVCQYPIFCVLSILVVRITIPPSIPPSHMYAPMSLNCYPRKGAGGNTLTWIVFYKASYNHFAFKEGVGFFIGISIRLTIVY